MKIEAQEIKARASGQWDTILSCLAPQVAPALEKPGRHIDCPIHGGKADFRVFGDVVETGGGICTCGAWGDGFALLQAVNGWTFPQTLEEVGRIILGGLPERTIPAKPTMSKKDKEKEDERIRESLNKFWQSCRKSAEGERILTAYFCRRGLRTSPLCYQDIRFHPNAIYLDRGDSVSKAFPAMVACVRKPDGKPVTLHRTYLNADGTKANVGIPKKLMNRVSTETVNGAAIRLKEAGRELAIAEGIETSVAVMEMTGLPCWSVVSATFMEHFVPPAGVEKLHVFADKDRSTKQHPSGHGLESAQKLGYRLKDDLIVEIHLPPIPLGDRKSVDWLDVVAKLRR